MKSAIVLGFVVLASVGSAFPVVTSFENPEFLAGSIEDQNGWLNVTGNYSVVESGSRTGDQAVLFSDSTGVENPWTGPGGDAGASNSTASVWINIAANSTSDFAFGLDVVYDTLSIDYSILAVKANGDVYSNTLAADPTLNLIGNVGSVAGSYVQVSVTTDTASNLVFGSVNGTSFMLPSLATSSSIRSVYMMSYNVSGSTSGVFGEALFDDYSFEPVPEPATITLLGVIGAGLLARRRPRK